MKYLPGAVSLVNVNVSNSGTLGEGEFYLPKVQEFFKSVARHGATEIIALQKLAAGLSEVMSLVGSFHALGSGCQAVGATQHQDDIGDTEFFTGIVKFGNEGPVNLKFVDGIGFQLIE